MKKTPFAVAMVASIFLLACSKHTTPDESDIKSALQNDGGVAKISDVKINQCTPQKNISPADGFTLNEFVCEYSATMSSDRGSMDLHEAARFRQKDNGDWRFLGAL